MAETTRQKMQRIAQKYPNGAKMERRVNGKIQERYFKADQVVKQLVHGQVLENPWTIAEDQDLTDLLPAKPANAKGKSDITEVPTEEALGIIDAIDDIDTLMDFAENHRYKKVRTAASSRIDELNAGGDE